MKRIAAGFTAIAVVFGVLITQQSGAFSLRELLGLDPKDENGAQAAESQGEAGEAGEDSNWGKPAQAGGAPEFDLDYVQRILENVAAERRQQLLADDEAFRTFVKSESDNVSILSAARANNVDKDGRTRFLMRRSAENILRESYLNRLFASKIPADFPSDQQVREYYDKNKDKFVTGDRVHVWQIYLPLGDAKDAKAVQKQAEDIIREVNAGKTDFAIAVWKYSAHDASRRAGGYMGLLKISDLNPEVRDPILNLAEGKLGGPVTGNGGVHIFRRGARVPSQQLAFDDIKDEIRQLLINQAQAQLRKAIYDQARQTYPLAVSDSKIEEWRLRLRTNLPATSGSAKAPPAN